MKKIGKLLGRTGARIRQKLYLLTRHQMEETKAESNGSGRVLPDNPCVPYMRVIVEQLLAARNIAFRDFYLILIDGSSEGTEEVLSMEETEKIESYQDTVWREQRKDYLDGQLNTILEQLAPGLNRLQIRTDRPAYFEEFSQRMYEENGLVVQLEEGKYDPFPTDSVVLDFELEGSMPSVLFHSDTLYLPIYKKPWQIAPNLDITVPIGYNTVIVKGAIKQTVASYPDRFEREFYNS